MSLHCQKKGTKTVTGAVHFKKVLIWGLLLPVEWRKQSKRPAPCKLFKKKKSRPANFKLTKPQHPWYHYVSKEGQTIHADNSGGWVSTEKSDGTKASGAAGLTQEGPISLASLRAELRSEFSSYGDTMRSFLKTEIESMGKEIRGKISSLGVTTKAAMKTIRDELTGKVERLFSMQAETANTQRAWSSPSATLLTGPRL